MIVYSFFAIPSLMATAFVIVLVSLKRDEYIPYVAAVGALMALGFTLLSVPQAFSGSPVSMQMEEWAAPFGITIYGDYLSIFLSNIIAFVGLLAITFSYRYVRVRMTKYYALLSLLLAGMLGVVHSGDLFNMFVFLELFSIASYGLVAFSIDKKGLEASIKYLVMGSLGTMFFLMGTAFLYGLTGSLNIADIAGLLGPPGPAMLAGFGLILSGLAIKAGLAPFHAWLLDAHPAAPSPVSAVLSGLMIGVGFYAALRVGFVVFSAPAVFLGILVSLGLLSMVLGALGALRQPNLKRMLAYSSVSQMGYISLAFGLGTPLAMAGGMFHLINQAVIKSLLFLCSGVMIFAAGTADFDRLAGRFGSSRLLSYAFLAGVLGLAGVPLFSGFASKWIIYIASYQASPLLAVAAILVSAITLAYGLRAHSLIFSGSRKGAKPVHIPMTMRIPLIILASIILLLGVAPWIGTAMAELMVSGLDQAIYIQGVGI